MYIYLNPGNWFELKNIIMDKVYPFDIESFKEEILNQVNNRSEKLSFIQLTFHKKYPSASVEEIKFYLDMDKFENIADMIKSETRHPIITFHGTSSLDAVNSILATGYIIPGTKSGVKKLHGSVYGTGIYSSPFFDKAIYYTTPDKGKVKYVYVLINIVMLGKMKLIPPNGTVDHSAPINGSYAGGFHTHAVYGLDQLISADPKRVIPIAVMKINIG